MISSPTNWEDFSTRTDPRGSAPPQRAGKTLPEMVVRDCVRGTLPSARETTAVAVPGSTPNWAEAWLAAGEAQVVRIMQLLRIGRGPENDCLLLEQGVSRRHAVIRADEAGDHWLLDLNTTNGTFLNDTRIEASIRLQPGDRIRIGPYRFVFHRPALPARP